VFAFETIDHFLEPFEVAFLAFIFGAAEPAVKVFIAVMAVLVIVGIAGLFVRRFFMVKISPDPKSWSSGVVAIMIFLLMVTYLYGLGDATRLPKTNWWGHAALILAFPPLICRSKHFHIIMAPINVFFRRQQLGDATRKSRWDWNQCGTCRGRCAWTS